MCLEGTIIATTIPEEDENRSSTSPQTESAATDITKQYDEFLVASLTHKERVVAVDAALNYVVASSKGNKIFKIMFPIKECVCRSYCPMLGL